MACGQGPLARGLEDEFTGALQRSAATAFSFSPRLLISTAGGGNRVSSGSWTRCFLRTSGGMIGSWWIGFPNTGAMHRALTDTK